MKKKVLVLDRSYSVKYMKSDIFETLVVCLSSTRKKILKNEGLKIVGCFEEEFQDLPISVIPDNYLIHSLDSDRFLRRFDYKKRGEILGKEISFWVRMLDTYKPDCIVNEIVTIEFMEVMYIEALRRNIPYYRWATAPFAPKDIWLKDKPFHSWLGLDFWNSVQETEDDIKNAERYIDDIRVKHRRPFYVNFKKKGIIQIISKKLKVATAMVNLYLNHYCRYLNGHFYYEDYYYIRKNDLKNYLSRLIYRKYDAFKPEDNIEYYFYPLHFEPEAAIEYGGYFFNNQIMLIERICHSMKVGQKLIVKEHPQQRGILMTYDYRKLKKRFSNIIFLQGNISAYNIYPYINCLITLNGTAGFESWISQKPVIVFGDVFYKDFPGVVVCENFKQLYEIVRKGNYTIADDDIIKKYIAKIYHNLSDVFPYLNEHTEKDSLEKITKQVETFLLK